MQFLDFTCEFDVPVYKIDNFFKTHWKPIQKCIFEFLFQLHTLAD